MSEKFCIAPANAQFCWWGPPTAPPAQAGTPATGTTGTTPATANTGGPQVCNRAKPEDSQCDGMPETMCISPQFSEFCWWGPPTVAHAPVQVCNRSKP